MNKKQIISLIIALVVFVALIGIQTIRGTKDQTAAVQQASEEVVQQVEQQTSVSYKAVTDGQDAGTFKFETNVFDVTFDKAGASVQSLKLKKHADADGNYSDMVFRGPEDDNAFLIYWGDDFTKPVTDNFAYSVDGNKITFTKEFEKADGKRFTLVRTYEFKNDDYMIAVTTDVVGSEITEGDYAFTVSYGPQVGPAFAKLSGNYEYRRLYAGVVGKNGKVSRSTIKFSKNQFVSTRNIQWLSTTSKYFTVVARPEKENAGYKFRAVQGSTDTVSQTDTMFISVPVSETDANTVYFYCGPQLKQYLGSYYNGVDNEWGIKGYNLDDAMEGGSVLSWLENILKWCLTTLYKVIPNYGVGIIIVTILLKIILWPLQQKSSESTAKMGSLGPKLQEIKDKYPNNPQKQNEETQKLYKEQGVSPLGGCLPMLIQFPILIAFYGLLNKHFELRGAMFIPGWIPDLSVPDTVFTLGFNLPLLGNQIHLLPFIYTASMIYSMKFTQSATSQQPEQKTQMAFMTYGMPIMFFFILYSAPSGLLLYWSVQNLLSIAQQMYTNNKLKKGAFENKVTKKEPKAVLDYQEKLRKIEEAKKDSSKKGRK